MSDCPHHDVPRRMSAPSVCPLHNHANGILELSDQLDPHISLVVLLVDDRDLSHRALASGLPIGVALHLLEQEVLRLRTALGETLG